MWIIFGGCTPMGRQNDVMAFSFLTNSWASLHPGFKPPSNYYIQRDESESGIVENDFGEKLPEPRSVHSFTRLKGKKNTFMLYGGIGMLNTPLNDAWLLEINEATGQANWTFYPLKYDHGPVRCWHSACCLKNGSELIIHSGCTQEFYSNRLDLDDHAQDTLSFEFGVKALLRIALDKILELNIMHKIQTEDLPRNLADMIRSRQGEKWNSDGFSESSVGFQPNEPNAHKMPPLKQPKLLSELSKSSFSSWYSLALYHNGAVAIDLFEALPQNLAEELSYAVLQAAFAVIHHFCSQCDAEIDDCVLIQENCIYLNRVLTKLLNPRAKYVDVDFDIDMRKFANFKINPLNEDANVAIDEELDNKLILTEHFLSENESIFVISNTIKEFLGNLEKDSSNLEVFNPGLYIIDRQNPEDDLMGDPHKVSLCWNQPQILINLVENAPKLTSLSLNGYEELTDLAVEYIAGTVGSSPGLKCLNELTLPKKCFVTIDGIRALIENLPKIEYIHNQGKMGAMISSQKLRLPEHLNCFPLKEFCQMESITSGGQEEDEDEITGEVQGWVPRMSDLEELMTVCPSIRSLKLLMQDRDLHEMSKILEDTCTWEIFELDIHLMNEDFVSMGINRFSVSFANTLTSLKLTILDCLSWHSIEMIGKYCSELKTFHLELWERVIMTSDDNAESKSFFENLQDLKIKCEDYIEPLDHRVIRAFTKSSSTTLKIIQIIAHLSWLKDEDFTAIWSLPILQSAEMIVIQNVDSYSPMELGLHSVHWLIEQCPNLTILGNLRTWHQIDYYNSESPHFYRAESQLSRLKREIVAKNWDLDLEIENLDYLYT